jgi:hypothetical protein
MDTKIKQKCDKCNQEYEELIGYAKQGEIRKRKHKFCSKQCRLEFFNSNFLTNCKVCGKEVQRKGKDKNKSKTGFFFCSRNCSANFNNQLRKKKRRSKIEQALFTMLKEYFPNLKIISNDREILQGLELDIYIPDIKLGIEWNGIVHFKPIYGMEKLLAVQEKDKQKMELANAKNIHLVVIPDYESKYSLVKEAFSQIKGIIEKLLSI